MKKYQLLLVIAAILVLASVSISIVLALELDQAKNTKSLVHVIEQAITSQNATPEVSENVYIEPAITEIPETTYADIHNNLTEDQIIDADMAMLTRLYKNLQKTYLWDIDHDAIYEAMATAMFDTLEDKYTYYVTEEESEEYEEETTGQYGGLGFYFSKTYLQYQDPEDNETLYCNISQVFPNTPSSRGGIKAGDMITHINGQSVVDLEATDCAKLMKGEIGTSVTITILRNKVSFDITLTRALITEPTVEYTMLEDNIGYIQILQFSRDTLSKMGQALTDLKAKQMKSLIIDLRDNPGGDVDITLNIANLFISSSELLKINYKDSTKNVVFKATPATLISDNIPMVCLVNKGTASSAEILSSTLRDNGRATLIGTTTFGKGIMQSVSTFGNGWTSITTASFVPPSGNEIHKIGVIPDIEVDSVYVQEDEVEEYTKLMESNQIQNYVKENPQYTEENVRNFAEQHPEIRLRRIVVELMVRNEYYSHMTYDEQPLADTWFDPQIKKAIEVLTQN